MFRCFVAELVGFGAGHALRGAFPRAVAWTGAIAATFVMMLWTPWALHVYALVRFASMIDAGRAGQRGPLGERWHWKPAAAFLFVSLGFVLTSMMYVAQPIGIASSSMSPTLRSDDVIIMDKLSLRWRSPERGEPVVYRAGGITSVGRVAAVGGDELAIRGGVIHLNGKPVPQRELGEAEYMEELDGHRYRIFLARDARDPARDYPSDTTTYIVPAGTVFILGDNRGNGDDSRWRGVFPASSVQARVVGIWFGSTGEGGPDSPFSRVGTID